MTRTAAKKKMHAGCSASLKEERLGNRASNAYKSFRTMLLTGSWPHLVSRYAGSDLRSRTGGFFLPFSIWEHPAVLGPPPEPGTEEAGSSIFFSYFRASSSHLNSFVKLSLASGQPFLCMLAECVRVGSEP